MSTASIFDLEKIKKNDKNLIIYIYVCHTKTKSVIESSVF